MAFTQDELQAFNNILDQKLSSHRRELERTLDQRFLVLRRELEQHLASVQQDLLRSLGQRITDQQRTLKEMLGQRTDQQQARANQEMMRSLGQRQQAQQQQFESFVERSLAAQLLGLEQLINQHLSAATPEYPPSYSSEQHPDFDSIEVQTEIPWEDLGQAFSRVLDDRLSVLNDSLQTTMKSIQDYLFTMLNLRDEGLNALNDSLQTTMKSIENYLSTLLLNLRDDMLRPHEQAASLSSTITNSQELFRSIEQLEHLIESMQVAMTANHALLSNRLYHHQQLPLERAHIRIQTAAPLAPTEAPSPNGTNSIA